MSNISHYNVSRIDDVIFFLDLFSVCMFYLHVCIYSTVPRVLGCQKRASDPLDLNLEVAVSLPIVDRG